MIPVCNRTIYLAQTLNTILIQAPEPELMEVEVIDNSTTNEGVESFVKDIAGDRVKYYRQPRHLTLGENWNTCIERSRGELVHIIHDDDYLAPAFYLEMEKLSDRFPEVGLLISRSFTVDMEGVILVVTDRLDWLESGSRDPAPNLWPNSIYCPGVVVRRWVYEEIGGFDQSLGGPVDYEMWMRGIARCGAAALPQPLAYYRVHSQGYTGVNFPKGEFLVEIWKAGERICSYAPGLDLQHLRRGVERQLIRACETYDREGAYETAAANFESFQSVASPYSYAIWFLSRIGKKRWGQLGRELQTFWKRHA